MHIYKDKLIIKIEVLMTFKKGLMILLLEILLKIRGDWAPFLLLFSP